MSRKRTTDVDGGRDPREFGICSAGEAARLIDMPRSTLRYWVAGGGPLGSDGQRSYRPIIPAADYGCTAAEVEDAIRFEHRVAA